MERTMARDIKNRHRKSSKPIPDCMRYIPQEIIATILSRLPVKSLLKFRCVSKSWLALISSSEFIKLHLQVSTMYPNRYQSHKLLLYPYSSSGVSLYSYPISSIMNKKQIILESGNKLECPIPKSYTDIFLLGSCNGLILICIEKYPDILILWNPSTRKSRKLPNSGDESDSCLYKIRGFGYDESIDDYKVVEISTVCKGKDIGKYATKVYSSRRNSWKEIGVDHQNCCIDDSSTAFVNGAIHWQSLYDNDNGIDLRFILSFKMTQETFGKLALPVSENKLVYGSSALGVIHDSLGLSIVCHGIGMEIWAMKEYGVESSSWIKLHCITHGIKYTIPHSILFASKDGKILTREWRNILFYNSGRNRFESCSISEVGAHHSFDVLTYIESLDFF